MVGYIVKIRSPVNVTHLQNGNENTVNEIKTAIKAEPQWVRQLERALRRTFNPRFDPHQYLRTHKYAGRKGSAVKSFFRFSEF